MDIISIFNYAVTNKNAIGMLKTWGQQTQKHAKNHRRLIITNTPEQTSLCTTIGKIYGFEVEERYFAPVPINPLLKSHRGPLWNHNVNFKLWNNCQRSQSFIFIDLDAYLYHDIDDLISNINGQPFIGIEHEIVKKYTGTPKKKFFNGGVQIVSNPLFLDFEKIRAVYRRDRKLHTPGAEQALLNLYCDAMKYDWSNPNIGQEWNSWVGYVKFLANETAYSTYPNNPHPAYIIHYWWTYKPWAYECPFFVNE